MNVADAGAFSCAATSSRRDLVSSVCPNELPAKVPSLTRRKALWAKWTKHSKERVNKVTREARQKRRADVSKAAKTETSALRKTSSAQTVTQRPVAVAGIPVFESSASPDAPWWQCPLCAFRVTLGDGAQNQRFALRKSHLKTTHGEDTVTRLSRGEYQRQLELATSRSVDRKVSR